MESLIDKYTERLKVLKENRANTVDTNTDAENELYDKLIQQVAEFARDLKQLEVSDPNFPEKEEIESEAESYATTIIEATNYSENTIHLRYAFKAGVEYIKNS